MKTYIGVDPGFSGALACLHNLDIEAVDMPIIKAAKNELDSVAVAFFLKTHEPGLVVIEKAQSMPGQGISSTGRYMESYGRIRGLCEGMGIPYVLVHPRTWKKVVMSDMGKEKGESIVKVKQLYPSVSLPRKKDHGKADAILLCEYARRMNL